MEEDPEQAPPGVMVKDPSDDIMLRYGETQYTGQEEDIGMETECWEDLRLEQR